MEENGLKESNRHMQDTTTFLLVEDDPNDVLLLEMEFQNCRSPIRLFSVGDGGEAIDYLEGRGRYSDRDKYPQPDVVLLDLKMPRINGFQFLEWLRKSSTPNRLIPVVVMSSSALREDVDKAYTLGANSYMVKPIGWHLFKERIQTLGIYWSEHTEKPECHA
jgi:CheY-like chemotaxis protein